GGPDGGRRGARARSDPSLEIPLRHQLLVCLGGHPTRAAEVGRELTGRRQGTANRDSPAPDGVPDRAAETHVERAWTRPLVELEQRVPGEIGLSFHPRIGY